jgi:hypothetical protein
MTTRISQTGIRSGEFITSSATATQNKGTIMQIRGWYPPSRSWLESLTTLTLRDEYNQFPFFAPMSAEQRLTWLQDHATENPDLYMEDVPELAIKFVTISGKFFTEALTAEQISQLQRGNPNDPEGFWPIQTVYQMFPRKPGSKARKHTLIFRPNNWRLMPGEVVTSDYTGPYINLDTLSIQQGHISKPKGGFMREFKFESSPDFTLAIVTSQVRPQPMTWESLLSLVAPHAETMQLVRPIIEWFPPALHKSLIQKLIRTRCREVEFAGKNYPAGGVLLASMARLLLHPGSFVPNIQRFVSGIESAAKRTAVSIDEDSFLEDNRYLLSMYAGVLIAQHDRSWQPTDQLIYWWFLAALTAQQDPRMYKYDWRTFRGPLDTMTTLGMTYYLLKELRSFEYDIAMVGSIAENQGQPQPYQAQTEPMAVMPLLHCVDQHTYTQIAHYMPYTPEKDYSTLFGQIWDEVVGMNPRKEKYAQWTPETPFIQQVRLAQWRVWVSQTYTPQSRNSLLLESYLGLYQLDPSWLAGLIGPIEVRVGHTTAMVVLRTNDITEMTAVKRPSRDKRDAPELTEEEKLTAIELARTKLQAGIPLQVPETLQMLAGSVVRVMRDTEEAAYYIYQGNESKHISEAFTFEMQLELHPPIEATIESSLQYTGDGVSQDADTLLEQYLPTIAPAVLRRLMTYITASRTKIQLHKISRDGTGVDYAVSPEDTGVNYVLATISVLYPGALEPTSSGYKVKNGPLFWIVRDQIQKFMGQMKVQQNVWAPIVPDNRKLYEHQREAVEDMIAKVETGGRGHEIWIPVGLGKTLIFMRFIMELIQRQRMPTYCVYTLPSAAVNSIETEFDTYNIPYQVIDMRVDGVNQIVKPGIVNLVWHNHLRLNGFDGQLRALSPNLLFVTDEFHHMLGESIQASIALEISSLSVDFIAMSGTIMRNEDPHTLIQWLAMIVEFEVTPKNYWVAVGALISKKVQTNVAVERAEIEAPLLHPEEYYASVPIGLGGTAPHLNFKRAIELSRAAMYPEVLRQAVSYIQQGEPVFLVARNAANQQQMADDLTRAGVQRIHLITKDTPITLLPGDTRGIQAVITTPSHSAGYSLSGIRVMISEVIFSNQTTRDQLEGRINRVNQQSPVVRYLTVSSGIFSYIQKRYNNTRTLSEALKGFAQDVKLNVAQIRALMQT